MPTQNVPAAGFDVTEVLVRALLVEQHPDLADRSLTLVANGWDNAIFRLGDDLVVRMPRRRLGADLVEHEQRWLPELAPRLPIPIAAPVRVGVRSAAYPWRWSICPWFEGDVAADVELADPHAEAIRLGAFVHALHLPAPPDAPANPHRGQPVAELRRRVGANVDLLGDLLGDGVDPSTVRARFDQLASVREWDGPPLWLHGDLHTANVVVADGRIRAVLDLGDLTGGDPAVDLAIAWMLFTGSARRTFRLAAGDGTPVDDATWGRAQAWALHFAVLYLLHSGDSERFRRMGAQLLAAVLADD